MAFLDRYSSQAYALLRIVAGLMFMAHGVQKFFNFPVAFPYPMNPMLMAAAGIELIAGALIVVGLFTRPAAFVASGMSAVGYWMAHGLNSPFPIVNGGETIALYCFIFLVIATHGAGVWSMDGARKSR